jgi:YD repeat-containing protein
VLKAHAGSAADGHVTVLKAHAGSGSDGHVTVLKAHAGSGSDGHVTVLKAHAGSGSDGHVTVLKAHAGSGTDGHVTVLKARADGPDDDCDGALNLLLHSGEIQQQVTDLALPGRSLDFAWTRTYRSRTGASTPQGNRWTHGYDVRCALEAGESAAWVYDGTGRKDRYVRQPDGTFTCPGFFREGSLTNGVFRLTFADTGFWSFRPFDASPAAGKLAGIQDRNGNALALDYDGSGRLTQVTDTLGRVHVLHYTPQGRIASVTDSTGRAITYTYYADGETGGSLGDLKSVTSPPVTGTPNGNDFPDGKTVSYTYTAGHADDRANGLLTGVTDALGQSPVQLTYDLNPASFSAWRVVTIEQVGDATTQLTYMPQAVSSTNRFAALRCIVNDPLGNVSESFFDLRNRCVSHRAFTGRAVAGRPVTDTFNRPTAKLRDTDPDLFETALSWNRDSLLLGASLPGGAVISCAYEADVNPLARARKRGDLRAVRQRAIPGRDTDSDGDGIPDLTEITRSYTYDPRFGSDPTSAGLRTRINELEARLSALGLLSRASAPLPRVVKGSGSLCGDTDHFRVSATDPLGTMSTAAYDERGNMISCQDGLIPRGGTGTPTAAFGYDAHGQLTSLTNPADAAGLRKVDAFSWHQGLVTQIVEDAESGGLHLETAFERDARGNVTRLTDARGNDLLVTYTSLNQPLTVDRQTQGATFGERVRSSFSYDANNNLVGVVTDNRHPEGAFDAANPTWETSIAYDALNRPYLLAHELTHTVQQRVMTNLFAYDANSRLVAHLLPEAASGAEPDNAIIYAYDERGLLLREERAPGTGLSTVDTFDYDGDGNLVRVSKSDAVESKQTAFDLDGFGRCVRVTDAMGNSATRCFDASGRLTYERADGEPLDLTGGKGNRKLAETRTAYDALGRPIGRTCSFFDPSSGLPFGDGKSDSFWAYAPNGQLVSCTDDNGQTATFVYDRVGQLARVTDPKGHATDYAYDPNGNVLSVTQTDRSDVSAGVQAFARTFAYDTLDRCTNAGDNAGNTVTYTYDSCDNPVAVTDPSGNETVTTYDGIGRVLSTACYDGAKERGITINTSHVEYRNNRLLSSTDGNGNATAYAYDACDRCVGVTFADATTETHVWSPRSNLSSRTDANGTTEIRTYDLCDRLVLRDIAVGGGVLPTTTYEAFGYDGLGRLVAAQNNASSLAYAYDSLGNRVSSSQDGFVTTAAYDGMGNRLTCSSPSGYSVSTAIDALNRPSSVSVQAPSASEPVTLATFAYDGPDRLARVTRANGINTRIFWNGQQGASGVPGDYGWQQVARINHARAGGGQVVDQRVSAYDRSQNRVLRAMTAPWSTGGSLATNTFGYDGTHRLTRSRRRGASVEADVIYVLDANGNRLQVTNNGIAEAYAMDSALPAPADAQMNQYTETPFGTEGYDARGNRVIRASSAATRSYHFDYAGRLVQVDELDPVGATVPVAAYSYDPLGRRIAKTVFAAGGLPPVITAYVYDDGRDDDCDGRTDDAVLETYVNGAFASVRVLAGGAGGGAAAASYAATGLMLAPPLALLSASGEALYTHCDDLGNVLALTDAAGNVVEHYDYDDFGAPRFFDASGTPRAGSAVGNDLLFRGLRWDSETALYHRSGNNPLYQQSSQAGSNPIHGKSSEGGGVTWHECFITGYGLAAGGGGGTFQECFVTGYSVHIDPQTGQTLSRGDTPARAGANGRAFEANNPWSLKKEEGGRHTPFHNKYRPESAFRSVSSVLKTKHDTAKNSVGNIR